MANRGVASRADRRCGLPTPGIIPPPARYPHAGGCGRARELDARGALGREPDREGRVGISDRDLLVPGGRVGEGLDRGDEVAAAQGDEQQPEPDVSFHTSRAAAAPLRDYRPARGGEQERIGAWSGGSYGLRRLARLTNESSYSTVRPRGCGPADHDVMDHRGESVRRTRPGPVSRPWLRRAAVSCAAASPVRHRG
jgi:hypothetical protein